MTSREEKRRRIPRLPNRPVVYDPPDRGALLPAPSDERYEYVNTAGPYELPVIVARPKPWPSGS